MKTIALLIFAVLAMAMAMASAAGDELQLANGSSVTYQELILAEDAPMSLVTVKNAGSVHTYRYSEVAIDALPAELRQRVTAYAHDQLQKRMIIKDDKWIHRDEVLLNGDPRYLAKGKLAKIGPSILTFTNTTDKTVTIAVRCEDKGYEMHIEAGKSKGYQVQNGKVFYVMAQESEDGKKLVVQKSEPLDLKNVNMKVTIVRSDAIPPGEMGTIDIPEKYQVR
jgi:biopolymer transport protein ExbD